MQRPPLPTRASLLLTATCDGDLPGSAAGPGVGGVKACARAIPASSGIA